MKNLVTELLLRPTFEVFSNILALWNQGNYCFDCSVQSKGKDVPTWYVICKCESCTECDEYYCICPIKNKKEIPIVIWEFAKIVFSKEYIYEIIRNVKRRTTGYEYSKLISDLFRYTNNKPLPSYPKYKKIAKELFDL